MTIYIVQGRYSTEAIKGMLAKPRIEIRRLQNCSKRRAAR